VRFRAISTRTREQVGKEFDAPDWGAAKVIGAMRETSDTRVVIQEVHPAQASLDSIDVAEELDKMAKGREEDKDLPLQEVERRLDHWLHLYIQTSTLELPRGFRLVPHVHRGIDASMRGQWSVTITLVQDDEKQETEKGSSPSARGGNGKEPAGS